MACRAGWRSGLRWPWVLRLVRLETNHGFGRAINRVALTFDHEALALVNNDTVCLSLWTNPICRRPNMSAH